MAVWQSTPRMADVIVTKITGYVRVRILMNWCFFSVFWGFILFMQRPLFTCRVHMHLTPAGGASERRMRSLAIGRRVSQQCWGVTAGKARHNSSNVRGVTAGKVGCNSSYYNYEIPLTSETRQGLSYRA